VAIQTFDKNKNTKRDMGEYHYYAGLCYFELNLYDEALQNFELACDFDKQKGIYHYHKALVRSRLDKVPEAIKSYQESFAFFDSDEREYIYQARFNKGICHRRIGEIEQSIVELKKAIDKANEMSVEKPSAYNNIGLSFFEQEDYESAIENYDRAIKIDPSATNLNNRGLAYY
jgi:tetratricopeptide (TPR) repeat protein